MIAERFLLDEDREVHSRARTLFPDAAMVTRQAYEAACWQTQDLMERTATTAVLEAAFGTGSCKARADSLVRSGDEWHLHEIKAHTGLTTNLVDEVGFVWMVLDLAGVHLGRASVLLVSPAFRAGMPDRDLFTSVDITESAASRARDFAGAVATIDAATRTTEPPAARLIPHCRRCPLFSTCTGAGIAHSLFELPHVTPLQLERMLAQGYRSVADLPAPTLLKRRQSAVWQSVITEQMVLTGDLRGALAAVVWPARYLDFETVGTALPLFPGLAPFEQLPFLYSVRTRETPEAAPSHHGFLAPHDREGSRELAERLLQDLGSDGSVVIYSQYQARVMRWLGQRYPDLSEALTRIRDRMIDLEAIIRRNVSHPQFRGRTSMKTVLPALVPGFSYIDLEIEDAPSAGASYAYLSKDSYYSAVRAPLIRRDLYAFCARDTLALVRVHETLQRVASGG